ncbi:MAG: hypothetical protein DLD55_03880 [candidate division SR1 bacterium]|nr:MAG: hypothetical protein DLD55_03880 [candidate division SR1 bacterium]
MTALEKYPSHKSEIRTCGLKKKCLTLALATILSGMTPLNASSQNQKPEKVSPETEMLDKKATDLSNTENNANILRNEGGEIITLSGNITAVLTEVIGGASFISNYVCQNATPLLENDAIVYGQELMSYFEANENLDGCHVFCADDNKTYFNIEGITIDLDGSHGNFIVEGNTIIINGSTNICIRKNNGDRVDIYFNYGYSDALLINENGDITEIPPERKLYLGGRFVEEIQNLLGEELFIKFNDNDKVTFPELESGHTFATAILGYNAQGEYPENTNDLLYQGEYSLPMDEILRRLDHSPSSTEIIDLGNGVKLIMDIYTFRVFSGDGMTGGIGPSSELLRIAVVKGGLAPVDVNIENEGVGGTFEIFPFIWELGAFSEEPLTDFFQVPIGSKLQLKIQPKEGYKIKRIIINGEEQNLDDPNATTVIEIEFKKLRENSITVEFKKNQEAPQGSINLMPEENGYTEFYKELENGERSSELSDTELDNLEVGTKIKAKSFDDPGYYTKEVWVNNIPHGVDENNELEFEVEEGNMNIKVVRELDTSSIEVAESKVKIGTSNGEIIIMPKGTQISNLDIYTIEGKRISYTGVITDDLRVSVEEGFYIVSFDENRKRITKKVLVE